MATFANTQVAPAVDGTVYASNTPVTTNEADLANVAHGAPVGPLSVTYNAAFMAVIQLTLVGTFSANTTYIVAQTDLGDGVWVDVAWIVWTGTVPGTAIFVLSGGVAGANAFQQTRAVGGVPSGNGSNQIPLAGRIRFVGKTTLTSGSSSSSSSGAPISGVTATIRVKQMGLT